MNKERKIAYMQTRIEQLNSELEKAREEIKRLNESLDGALEESKRTREESEEEHAALEEMIRQYRELIDGASEAKDAYTKAVAELRVMRAEFQKETKKQLKKLRKQTEG